MFPEPHEWSFGGIAIAVVAWFAYAAFLSWVYDRPPPPDRPKDKGP